jgi:hypothetical protein
VCDYDNVALRLTSGLVLGSALESDIAYIFVDLTIFCIYMVASLSPKMAYSYPTARIPGTAVRTNS